MLFRRAHLAPFLLIFGLLFLTALPFLVVTMPPLVDYPNHMARIAVIIAQNQGQTLGLPHDPYYQIVWQALPNVMLDVVVPFLAQFMSLDTAMRGFVAVSLLLTASGGLVLSYAIWRRWSYWHGAVFVLLQGRVLLWGLLNYLMAMGLVLWAMAVWVTWRERKPALAISLMIPLSLAVYFSHIAGFVCLASMLLGWEIYAILHHETHGLKSPKTLMRAKIRAATTRLALDALVFILPAAIWLQHYLAHRATALGEIHFAPIWRKIDMLFFAFKAYDVGLDSATAVLFGVTLVWGLCRGGLRFDPRMKYAWFGLAGLYVAMPSYFLTGSMADKRLVPLLLIGLVCALAPPLDKKSVETKAIRNNFRVLRQNWGRIAVAGIIALAVLRLGYMTVIWYRQDEILTQSRQVLQQLPPGAKLAVARIDAETGYTKALPPFDHFPTLAVALRMAYVPGLFAYENQQILRYSAKYQTMADPDPNRLWSLLHSDTPLEHPENFAANFDYLLVMSQKPMPDFAARPALVDLHLIALPITSPLMRLYRFDRPPTATP